MRNKKRFNTIIIGLVCFIFVIGPITWFFVQDLIMLPPYYAKKDSYITTTGLLTKHDTHPDHESGLDMLYLYFDNLDPKYADNRFAMIPANYEIAKQNGLDEKLKDGQIITFVSANRYFGDGYRFPIVALTIDGEEFLTFDEGYENLLIYLNDFRNLI